MDAPIGTVGTNISHVFDGMYYGFVLATLLAGVTLVQGWSYVNNFKDPWPLRIAVAILILGDLFATCLDVSAMHTFLVVNFGNLAQLSRMTDSLNCEVIVTVVIVFLVQLFLAGHIYLLDQNSRWICSVIIFFATGSFVAGVVSAAALFDQDKIAYLATEENKILFGIRASFSAVAGVITTTSLTRLLSSAKTKTKLQCSDTMMQKLMIFIVHRGLLVSVAQVLFFVIYLARPIKLYWVPLHFMSSKFYVITMMAILNERQHTHTQEEVAVSVSSIIFSHPVPLESRMVELSQRSEGEDAVELERKDRCAVDELDG
ncbi:hypothetical protein BV22DRAFT_6166 [Leucogyrophana mollusca]|uniref:Uncharacterized protein n=1 Tax=Leucogyrophana mollusca TaxID=85980 RepID=A0ACB8C0S4_9AGAM|nr:hypothetical protein BV22DRAFT_6166 [Leucogyrophana mollusca]